MNYLQEKKKALSSGGWWVDSSCLAAFRFKGAATQVDALHDMSGNGYDLTAEGSPSWSTANGFTLNTNSRYLSNSSLNTKAIKTIIVRYSDLTSDENKSLYFAAPGGSNNDAILMARISFQYFQNGSWTDKNSNYAAFLKRWKGYTDSPLEYRRGSSKLPSSGVFGGSGSGLYLNGVSHSSSNQSQAFESISSTGFLSAANRRTVGPGMNGGCKVLGIAFYGAVLSAAVHKLIYDNMIRF